MPLFHFIEREACHWNAGDKLNGNVEKVKQIKRNDWILTEIVSVIFYSCYFIYSCYFYYFCDSYNSNPIFNYDCYYCLLFRFGSPIILIIIVNLACFPYYCLYFFCSTEPLSIHFSSCYFCFSSHSRRLNYFVRISMLFQLFLLFLPALTIYTR